jgi:cytoskeletal protein RodZ
VIRVDVYDWLLFLAPKTQTPPTSSSSTTTASSSSTSTTSTSSSSSSSSSTAEYHTDKNLPSKPSAVVIANAGVDQQWVLPVGEILLDGSNSTGPTPSAMQYAWTQVSGPTFATIQDGDRARARIINPHLGEYKFKLKVTVPNSGSSEDVVTVTVVESE